MKRRPKLTENQFDKWAEQLHHWVQESVSPFEDDSPEKQEERKKRASHDFLFFCQTYLPHYFSRPFAGFHDEWSDLLEIWDECAFIAAPREHAKSTFFTFALPIWAVCHDLRKFILIISDTNDQATGFTLPIRAEFEDNARLKYDYVLTFSGPKKQNDYTINESRLLARGRGEKVRGQKHRQHRPDLAIADDCENDLNVQNPKQVKNLRNWLLRAVIGSMGDGFAFYMVGNLFHPKSVLSQFCADLDENGNPRYISRIYRAILDPGTPAERPLWPDVWPLKRLLRKKALMGSSAFNAEMMNLVDDEDSHFKAEWFRWYDRSEVNLDNMTIATFVDPSAKSTENADFKAIVTVGLDRESMQMYVLHARIRRDTVGGMFDAAYQHIDEYGGVIGIESNMFEDFLHQAILESAKRHGRFLAWHPIRHTSNKITRIVGTLSYLIEHGKLLFQSGHSDQDRLVEQLIYINNNTVNDDGPDALEGAVALLQRGSGSGISTGKKRKTFNLLKGFK